MLLRPIRSHNKVFKLANWRIELHISTSPTLNKKNDNREDVNRRLYDLLDDMDKDEVNLSNALSVRVEKRPKTRSNNVYAQKPSSTIFWQVLGNGTYGGSSSLLLQTNFKKYLFNCGEGTQRLTYQFRGGRRILSQLGHVFITSKTWRYLAGLPGVCLSARSENARSITIHGPPGCMELYEAVKGFVTLFEFDVHAHNNDDGIFNDRNVKVEDVKLHRTEKKKCPDLPPNWKGDEQGRWDDYDDTVHAYICQFNHWSDKLDSKRLRDPKHDKGVLRKLMAGGEVAMKDGKFVKSANMKKRSEHLSSFLVLDVPDLEYLNSFENCEKLQNVENLEGVFHFTPYEVVITKSYRKWMRQMGEHVNHIFLNESCKGLGLPPVSEHSLKLGMIRKDLFPALVGAQDILAETEVEDVVKYDMEDSNSRTPMILGVTGLRLNVRPHDLIKIDYSEVAIFNKELAVSDMLEGTSTIEGNEERDIYIRGMKKDLEYALTYNPDPLKSLTDKLAALDGIKQQPAASSSSTSYPVITFLGTGSTIASLTRNVAGILVETHPGSFILMDCGEGTFSQLVRLKGKEGAEKVLMNLKGIYISHMHADHHLGLISLIQYRERAFMTRNTEIKKLYIISTGRLAEYLTYYHSKFESVLCNVELVKCEQLILYNMRDRKTLTEDPSMKHQLLYPDTLSRVLSDLGLVELYTSRALHSPHAFCLAIRTNAGYKLAYSGDTRPFQPFRDICAWGGAPDLLIHEATVEHFRQMDAIIKKHSTFTEAIQEGHAMNAKFTLLTHFSQRYGKIPCLDEIQGKPNVGIAFDNMVVNPDTMKMIPALYPAITRLFWKHILDIKRWEKGYKTKFGENGCVGSSSIPIGSTPSNEDEKKQLAEMLQKRYEQKLQWSSDLKHRSLLLKKQEDEFFSS